MMSIDVHKVQNVRVTSARRLGGNGEVQVRDIEIETTDGKTVTITVFYDRESEKPKLEIE